MTPELVSPEGAVGVAGALAGAAFALSKFMGSWKKDGAEGAGHDAMKATMDSLAAEIDRLGKHNATMAAEINKAQLEIIEANKKLIEAQKQLANTPSACPECGFALR